jgi:acyl-CoA thioesterase-2
MNPRSAAGSRLPRPVGDDPQLHRALLAWLSDMQLLGTCVLPHGLSWQRHEITSASLDHAVWFHDEARRGRVDFVRRDEPLVQPRARPELSGASMRVTAA